MSLSTGTATEIALRKIDPKAAAFDHACAVPTTLRRFFERALAQAPEERYRSALERRQALAEAFEPEVKADGSKHVRRTSSSISAFATASLVAVFALAVAFAVRSTAKVRPPVVEPAASAIQVVPAAASVPRVLEAERLRAPKG